MLSRLNLTRPPGIKLDSRPDRGVPHLLLRGLLTSQ